MAARATVTGIDLGHGETMVAVRIGSKIVVLRQCDATARTILTACAMVFAPHGMPIVLIGSVLYAWDRLEHLAQVEDSWLDTYGAKLLMEYYRRVLVRERPYDRVLYIPCPPDSLTEKMRACLTRGDDGTTWQLEQATFTPVYQCFKESPELWDAVCDVPMGVSLTCRDLMVYFLKALRRDLELYNADQPEALRALDGQLNIGVPASPAYMAENNRQAYAAMLAQAWSVSPEQVGVYAEPFAALLRHGVGKMMTGTAVADGGSGSLDGGCIGMRRQDNGKRTLCCFTASTDGCGGGLVERDLLTRILQAKKISRHQLRPGEAEALQLMLRYLKEEYCSHPADDLTRSLLIHLNDGSVIAADFNIGELLDMITGEATEEHPESAWYKAAWTFFRDMKDFLALQNMPCHSYYLTGGNANVPAMQRALLHGLGDAEKNGITVQIARDKSSAVVYGLCSIPGAEDRVMIAADTHRRLLQNEGMENRIRHLRQQLKDIYRKHLPQVIIEAAEQLIAEQRPCRRSKLYRITARKASAQPDIRVEVSWAFAAFAMENRDAIFAILREMGLTALNDVGYDEEQMRQLMLGGLPDMQREFDKMNSIVSRAAVCSIDFRGLGVNVLRRMFALQLAVIDVAARTKNPKFGLLEDSKEVDFELTVDHLKRIQRRVYKDETLQEIDSAMYLFDEETLPVDRIIVRVLKWYIPRLLGLDFDEYLTL